MYLYVITKILSDFHYFFVVCSFLFLKLVYNKVMTSDKMMMKVKAADGHEGALLAWGPELNVRKEGGREGRGGRGGEGRGGEGRRGEERRGKEREGRQEKGGRRKVPVVEVVPLVVADPVVVVVVVVEDAPE